MILENQYGKVNFMDECPVLFKRNKIGINLSGGVDSAFLMFATLKKISEKNLDVEVIPITGVDTTRPTNEWNAREIMDLFAEMFPDVNIGEHQFNYYTRDRYDKKWKHRFHERIENKLFLDGTIDVLFHGVTQNPGEEVMKEFGFYDNREVKRDDNQRNLITAESRKPLEKIDVPTFLWYAPFAFVTKQFIAEEYKKHGLLDELFPITASCVGYKEDTNFFTEPCKKCWWCKEKYWAFGSYDIC